MKYGFISHAIVAKVLFYTHSVGDFLQLYFGKLYLQTSCIVKCREETNGFRVETTVVCVASLAQPSE